VVATAVGVVLANRDDNPRVGMGPGMMYPGSSSTGLVSEDTRPTLQALVQRSDLLVVGSRSHSLVGGAVLGSVSQHVLQHATCTVAIIR